MRLLNGAKLLFNGSVAMVYLSKQNTIIKKIPKCFNYRMERTAMETLSDKNITPNLLCIHADEHNIYLEMEYFTGGDLMTHILMRDHIPYFDESSLIPIQSTQLKSNKPNKIILKSMVDLLIELRTHSMLHLDVKPENFVFTDKTYTELRVIDFGSAQYYNFKDKNEVHLSQNYRYTILYFTGIL